MIKALGGEAVMKHLVSLQIPTPTLIFQLTSALSGLDLPSVPSGGASDELHNRLIEIIDDITSARDKMIPIRQLHAIQRQYPSTDIHVYLQKISAAFRRFVLDTLVKLDELDRAQEVYESSQPDLPRTSPYETYRAGRTSPPAYQLPLNVSTTKQCVRMYGINVLSLFFILRVCRVLLISIIFTSCSYSLLHTLVLLSLLVPFLYSSILSYF